MKKFLYIVFIFYLVLLWACTKEKEVTIGVAFDTLDHVFLQVVQDEMEKTGREMGIKIVSVDAKNDPAEQVKQISNFTNAGLDAIIAIPITQDITPTITEKALDAEIPLVYVNRAPLPDAFPSGKKVAVVASPEIEAGIGQAKYVVKRLNGHGNVVILEGLLGSAAQVGRTKGVKEYLAANAPGITIIKEQVANWMRPNAVSVMENWLASGDTIDAVFANNDEMAIGAGLALREHGIKDNVIVVGVDATADGIAALEAGNMDMTMFQNGKAQGRGAVEVAVKMIKGESFEQNVEIPFELVTIENADEYKNK